MFLTRITLLISILLPVSLSAQKNLTEVTKSAETGILLPAGSKQDKRILSVAAARTLLEMQATETGRSISGTAEVLIIPVSSNGGGASLVRQSLSSAGYKISVAENDPKYSILEKESKSWLIYIDETKTGTDFYTILLTDKPAAQEVAKAVPAVSEPAVPAQVQSNPTPEIAAAVTVPEKSKVEPLAPLPASTSTGFSFSTTNFTDGWIATITGDYVLVTKNGINVRLYYSAEITDQMRPPAGEIHDYFWNTLVIPSFNIINAWKWEESITYFRTYYIWAEAVEKSTGRNCYIGLNVAVNNGIASPVLAIANDKLSYDSQFPKPENITNMLGYNRFAVALTDLPGTWSESGGTAANYYNSYTGAYAGMAFSSSSSSFTFSASGEYSSKHSGASGTIGNTQYYNQEYKGMAKVIDWEITLPNRWKGQTDVFEAWFEAVRGGRVLKLVDKNARGITYNLVRINQ